MKTANRVDRNKRQTFHALRITQVDGGIIKKKKKLGSGKEFCRSS